MGIDWNTEEVKLIVVDYFEMLQLELIGKKYNKSAHRKRLSSFLNNRDKAIEFKHRNISGVLANMGLPFIKGYKPLFNYQQILEDEVSLMILENKSTLEKEFKKFSEEIPSIKKKKIGFEDFLDKAPTKSKYKDKPPSFLPIKINYLAKEQNNRKIGEEGESLVLEYERWRLLKAGKTSLSQQIEWISKNKGDGLGFDILSKNTNGTDRYIEVKTTKLSKETPIYFSRNEMLFSSLNNKNFFLYRVYNLTDKPRLFIRNGEYKKFCNIVPQSFKGYF